MSPTVFREDKAQILIPSTCMPQVVFIQSRPCENNPKRERELMIVPLLTRLTD